MEHGADPNESRKQSLIKFLRFHCNFVKSNGECCNKPIRTGWITGCSHLFCVEHMQEWFSGSNECPICRAGEVNLVQMDFSRGVHNRSTRTALLGMMPTEIVQATETALTFWLDQKVHEFKMRHEQRNKIEQKQKRMEEHVKAELEEAERNCNKMEDEQQQVIKQISVVDNDISKAEKDLKEVSAAVMETEERYNSLQKRISGNQRQEFFRQPLSEAHLQSPHTVGHSRLSSAPPTPMEREPGYGVPGLGRSEQHEFRVGSERRLPSFSSGRRQGEDILTGSRVPGALFGSTPVTRPHRDFRYGGDGLPGAAPSSGRKRTPLFTPGCIGSNRMTRRRIS